MIPIKDEHQMAAMRQAGRIAANVLQDASQWVKAGVTTRESDEYAASRIRHMDAKVPFLGTRCRAGNIPATFVSQ